MTEFVQGREVLTEDEEKEVNEMLVELQDAVLNDGEFGFVEIMVERCGKYPGVVMCTEKQLEWLKRIYRRVTN